MMKKTELQTEIAKRKEADIAYLLLSDEQIEAEILSEKQKKAASKNADAQTAASGIISIDRSKPFNPEKFIGNSWSIKEQDERSLALTELDLSKIRLEHMLKDGETSVKGEEKLKRLKEAEYVRLDAKVFQTLWENKQLIPESWKEKTNNQTTRIFFNGTVVCDPHGYRYVLFLYWDGGEWDWFYYWLEYAWHSGYPSAVLASSP